MLARYDAECRGARESATATWSLFLDPVWVGAFSGVHGLISWRPGSPLSPADVDELIARSIAAFRGKAVADLEWKVRHHDAAFALHDRLLAAGFKPDPAETIMMGASAALAAGETRHVVRAVGEDGDVLGDLQRIHDMHSVVWPDRRRSRPEVLPEQVPEMFFVEIAAQVVGAGRIETTAGSKVAFLFGGAVHPDWRGRGIYRALLIHRARLALARGCDLIAADCTEYSRPILAASGLQAITTTAPYVLDTALLPR